MKNIKVVHQITILTAGFCLIVGTLTGCSAVKYSLYYPHTLVESNQASADWQEYKISPVKLDGEDFLAITIDGEGKTVCQEDKSAVHLCSAAATDELKRLKEERFQTDVRNQAKFDSLQSQIIKIVDNEPLPDLEIELVTDSGSVEKHVVRRFGLTDENRLTFDFAECTQSLWNWDSSGPVESGGSVKYSEEEKKLQAEKCEEIHKNTFVKIRVRSVAGMKIQSIKVEAHRNPYAFSC